MKLTAFFVLSLLALAATPLRAAPPVTSGLQVWLTAGAGTDTAVDGAPVSLWTDQQNGHVFSHANTVLPTFVADSGGGIPAIDFTRSSGFLGDFSGTAGSTIADATICVVGRFAGYAHGASSSSYWLSIDSATGGSEHTLGRDAGGSGADAIYHWRGQPSPPAYYGDNIVEDPDGRFTYYSAIFRGSGSGGGMSARINGLDGNLVNTGADSAYEADPAQTRIGLWTSNGSGLDGMIREVLIYDRILDTGEIAQVEAYLDLQADAGMPADPLVLDLRREGADVVLSWTGTGTLQSASAVTGPWSDTAPAANPMTVDTAETQTAFRLVNGMTTVPPGTVLGTRIASDTFREVEYHLDTGDLYFIGEQSHGFDWFAASGNDFWWCFMNTSDRGSGLLEYLMLHNPLADDMKAHAVTNGWRTYAPSQYSFLTFEPLSNQVTYANLLAPASPGQTTTTEAYTDDYVAVDHDELLILLYRNDQNQNIYLGIGNPSLVAAHGSFPPGDGTPERDNGVRGDVALKTNIQLTMDQKLILINTYPAIVPEFDDSSEAYFYVHPPGL